MVDPDLAIAVPQGIGGAQSQQLEALFFGNLPAVQRDMVCRRANSKAREHTHKPRTRSGDNEYASFCTESVILAEVVAGKAV